MLQPFRHSTWKRLLIAVKSFFVGEMKWKARMLFGALVALLLTVSALNVLNSYVGRFFMTAIADKQWSSFRWLALVYVMAFAGSTAVAAVYRFTEERLGLVWRDWLTRKVLERYMANHVYYRLNASQSLDNPDQRIAEDVKNFVLNLLSITLIFLNGTITSLAFAGVLLSISPMLFLVAVVYAAIGSLLTLLVGRRLVGLNYADRPRGEFSLFAGAPRERRRNRDRQQ